MKNQNNKTKIEKKTSKKALFLLSKLTLLITIPKTICLNYN